MNDEPTVAKSSSKSPDDAEALTREQEILRARIRRLSRENDQLRQLAATDYLTQIPNRRSFDDELKRRLAELKRHGSGFCLLLLDLDQFKSINDRFGHAVGDQVLIEFGKALTSRLRESDFSARYGGDEFAVMLPHVDLTQGTAAGQRILDEVYQQLQGTVPQTGEQPLAISIGLVEAHRDDTSERLIARVDRAMYQAKSRGGNQVVAAPRDAAE